jgi:gamma-glutamyltranspeptidase / glutathione hydrolase
VANVTELEALFLQPSTAGVIPSLIKDNSTYQPTEYDPSTYFATLPGVGLPAPDSGTSHMVTADETGLVVSLTTTVNLYWGSQIMVPETGSNRPFEPVLMKVVLNDEMNDFSSPGTSNAFGYVASAVNYPQPEKRPLSSMCPTIVELPNGTFYFATGAAGGSRIITSTVQNLWHVLDQDMDALSALAEPRLHAQIIPQTTAFEYAYDNSTVAYLQMLGHNVSWVAPGLSIAQAVMEKGGVFQATTDPRRIDSGGAVV